MQNYKIHIFVVLLLIACVLSNHFVLPLFFGVDLIFGSIFSLISIAILDKRYGIAIGIVSALYTYFLWNHFYAALVLSGEVIFVAYLWQRLRYNLVLASLLYWSFFGILQIVLYYHFFLEMDWLSATLAALKQAINGVFNAIIANLIVTYVPFERWFKTPVPKYFSVFHTTFTWLSTVAVLPVLAFMIIYSKKMVEQVEKDLQVKVSSISAGITIALERWQNQHQEVIQFLKNIAGPNIQHKVRLQQAVEDIKASFPYFHSVYVSDAMGKPLAFEPQISDKGIVLMNINLADRPYFYELKSSKSDFMTTPIYQGISVDKPLIVISGSILKDNEFIGGAFASIDVSYFYRLLTANLSNEQYTATLVDRNNSVVASSVASLVSLSSFAPYEPKNFINGNYYYRLKDKSARNIPMSQWNEASIGKFIDLKGIGDWKLYVELPLAKDRAFLYVQYVLSFSFLLVLLIVIVGLSIWGAKLIARPLLALSDETSNFSNRLKMDENVSIPKSNLLEINSLTNNFVSMMDALKGQFNSLTATNQMLEDVTNVGLSFRENLDLQKIIQLVTDTATKLSNAKYGAFFYNVVDEKGHHLKLYSLSGASPHQFSHLPMPRETKLFAPTFSGEKIVRYDDVTKSPEFGKNSPHNGLPQGHVSVKSYLAAPVILRSGEVIGVLLFGHPEAGIFTEHSEKLVSGIAAQASVAIDNARLYDALKVSENLSKKMASTQSFLAVSGKLLSSSLDLDVILEQLVKLVVSEIGDSCLVHLVGNNKTIQQMALAHIDPTKEADLRKLFDNVDKVQPEYSVYKVIKSGQPIILQNMEDEIIRQISGNDENYKYIKNIGSKSYVCYPLKVRDSIIGTISIARNQGEFSSSDLEFIEEIASRASLAIDNAKLYQEAQNINRVKDEFLATLSHELRTPLNVILGYSEILKEDYADQMSAEMAASLDVIIRNAKAQNQIIADLLDVSAIIAGKIAFTPTKVSINTVAKTAIDNIQLAAGAKNLKIKIQLDSQNPMIKGDSTRILQIIWNLLSNAVKFTPSHGEISIRTQTKDENVEIQVQDSGQGIETEFIPYIFDRFRQEDNSITRKYGGLGLGLSIVKQLVELHGGRIGVKSDGKGQGSVFTVTFPLLKAVDVDTENDISLVKANVLSGATILVVDDEDDARAMLQTILTRAGARVVAAASANEAVEMYKRELPVVIVSDIAMPHEDGYSFIQRLRVIERGLGRFTPAIALTSYAREEDRKEALAAGFQAHFSKPVRAEELIERIIFKIQKYS